MSTKRKITLTSCYGNLKPVTLLADDHGYVSYRQARRAQLHCAGDYYPMLMVDTRTKVARVYMDADTL